MYTLADVFVVRLAVWASLVAALAWWLRRALVREGARRVGCRCSSRSLAALALLGASLGVAANRVESHRRMTELGAQLRVYADEERSRPVSLATMARRDGARLPRASTALPLCEWSYATTGGLLVRRCVASPDEAWDVAASRFVLRVP